MKIVKNWLFKAASSVAALAMIIAVASVSATCIYIAYQPDVPEALK